MFSWPGYHNRQKPRIGQSLRLANPLTRSLRFFFPFNEGIGQTVTAINNPALRGTMTPFLSYAIGWGVGGITTTHDGTTGRNSGGLVLNTNQLPIGAGPFTVAFKGNFSAVNGANHAAVIQTGGFASSSSYVGFQPGGLPWVHWNGVDNYKPASGTTLPLNRTLTVTFVCQNSPATIKVYYDDYLAFSGANGFTLSNDSNGISRLLFGPDTSSCLDGTFHWLGWWDRALSAADVAQLSTEPYQMVRAPGIPQLWTPTDYPAAPTVAQTSTPTSVTLTWSSVAGATSYNVYRASYAGNETLLASGVVGTTYTDSGLSNGSTYYYKVSAVTALGEGPQSTEVVGTAFFSAGVSSAMAFFE